MSTPRTDPASSVTVAFSTGVDPSSFTADNLSLTRDGSPVSLGGSPVTVSRDGGSFTAFVISGLDAVTAAPGSYVLTVNRDGLRSPSGIPGAGSSSVTFVVAENFTPPSVTGTFSGNVITLKFGAAIDSTRASNFANYVLLPVPGVKPKKGHPLQVVSAVYNASNQTVTLIASQKLVANKRYSIRINGSAPDGLTSPGERPSERIPWSRWRGEGDKAREAKREMTAPTIGSGSAGLPIPWSDGSNTRPKRQRVNPSRCRCGWESDSLAGLCANTEPPELWATQQRSTLLRVRKVMSALVSA